MYKQGGFVHHGMYEPVYWNNVPSSTIAFFQCVFATIYSVNETNKHLKFTTTCGILYQPYPYTITTSQGIPTICHPDYDDITTYVVIHEIFREYARLHRHDYQRLMGLVSNVDLNRWKSGNSLTYNSSIPQLAECGWGCCKSHMLLS